MHLAVIDWVIIAVYLAGCMAAGIWMRRFVRGVEDFAVAGRAMVLPGRRSVGLLGLAGLLVLFAVARDTDGWLYRGGFLLVAVLSVVVSARVAARRGGGRPT